MIRYPIACLIILLTAWPQAFAAPPAATDYQIKLDRVRENITQVLNQLNEDQNKRSSVRSELQKLERKIAKVSKSLRYTQRKHKKSTGKLKQLQADLRQLQKALGKQRGLLARQIRSAYAMGQQPQLKLVLNQQQPEEMGRAMVYYELLNRERSREISDYLQSIQKKQRLETTIAATTRELEQLVDKRLAQKQELTEYRKGRKQLLDKLDKDIDHHQLTLQDLENSRSRIEELLMSLGELLADIPSEPATLKPFSQLKGQLPWPVRGSFSARFGTSRQQGDLKWNGVVIESAYGTPVRAISNGRVAFADWLQGFGFITIIDHDDGYMSLYGHNQALYKQAGDWVEAGEVIATVGDSGGQVDSGLYFEIRYQGKPVNPSRWCSKKVRHVALQDE